MREFWVSSGHHFTRRTEGGGLGVTNELLLAYLARPELLPPEEACEAERGLHAKLSADPRSPVSEKEIAAIADEDARENWQFMIAFRNTLLASPSIEAAYLDIVRSGRSLPPVFMNQLLHLILRNALDGCEDPYTIRAAELFFRPQRVSFQDKAVLLADLELIEEFEGGSTQSPLVAMLGKEIVSELDVLDDGNSWTYWSRSDAHTMALNMGSNPKSRQGFCRAIEAFIRHLLNVEVKVEPLSAVEDHNWRWFVGLDAEGTSIGNAIWNGDELDPEVGARLLGLYRLTFVDQRVVTDELAGHPVYLLLGMSIDNVVRMKPQNLVVGLPLRTPGGAG
ncbi:MAG TPA: DUF6352 family protein [Saliniramus sp.]|nr:DUF6352 family protein [Saliniramus sp.]